VSLVEKMPVTGTWNAKVQLIEYSTIISSSSSPEVRLNFNVLKTPSW